jgi:hypothetical protein
MTVSKLIRGYKAASEMTGIPVNTLRQMVWRRKVRHLMPIFNELFSILRS